MKQRCLWPWILALILWSIAPMFWQLLRAGWRLWPFVGVITYTIIPTAHRVLFVDLVGVKLARRGVKVACRRVVASDRRRRGPRRDARSPARRRVRQAGAPEGEAVREVAGEAGEGHLAHFGRGNAAVALRGSHYISARLASQKAEPLAQDTVGLEAPVHAGRGGWL